MYAKSVRGKPFFALAASGTLGSARVEFNNTPQPQPQHQQQFNAVPDDADPQSNLLETFQLSDPDHILRTSYRFALVQKAARAMSVAKKVSIRMDSQGVLSLQFMIEVEAANPGGGAGGGTEKLSFVDFVVVPMAEEEDEEGGGEGEGDVDETMMMNGEGSGDEL